MSIQALKSTKEQVYRNGELRPLFWDDTNESVKLIDQRLLPYELQLVEITNVEDMANAIKDMVLRGAPLIGIAAAYGMALAAKQGYDLRAADILLRSTRPTAVNLMWALDLVKDLISYEEILVKAHWILEDDIARCKAMSKVGAEYIKKHHCSTPSLRATKGSVAISLAQTRPLRILTHCNAGALATGGYGTALGVIRTLHAEGLVEMVYADETRPRQQGARLTVWELVEDNIPVTLNTDNMAAHLMKQGLIDLVITGADRITANGDAANKIGTYGLAILAKYHNIPFYIAAPESTIDRSLSSGDEIIIEERDSSEVSHINGLTCTAASGTCFVNPGFDVTPNELIEAIFTEEGLTGISTVR